MFLGVLGRRLSGPLFPAAYPFPFLGFFFLGSQTPVPQPAEGRGWQIEESKPSVQALKAPLVLRDFFGLLFGKIVAGSLNSNSGDLTGRLGTAQRC